MDADAETASRSVAYRIEHHSPQGAAMVRHLVDIDLRADTTRISRLFQEVLANFQARGESGRLVMIEAATGEVVESATIPAAMGSNP